MSYTQHSGYVHMEEIMKNRSRKFAVAYYQTLNQQKREDLRGCLARLHSELETRKKAFEDLERIADKIDDLMKAPNQLMREISSDSEYESPRQKRARVRASTMAPQAQAQAPAPSGSWFSFGGLAAPPATFLANPASTRTNV